MRVGGTLGLSWPSAGRIRVLEVVVGPNGPTGAGQILRSCLVWAVLR
jgi:hypothetical protein